MLWIGLAGYLLLGFMLALTLGKSSPQPKVRVFSQRLAHSAVVLVAPALLFLSLCVAAVLLVAYPFGWASHYLSAAAESAEYEPTDDEEEEHVHRIH